MHHNCRVTMSNCVREYENLAEEFGDKIFTPKTPSTEEILTSIKNSENCRSDDNDMWAVYTNHEECGFEPDGSLTPHGVYTTEEEAKNILVEYVKRGFFSMELDENEMKFAMKNIRRAEKGKMATCPGLSDIDDQLVWYVKLPEFREIYIQHLENEIETTG